MEKLLIVCSARSGDSAGENWRFIAGYSDYMVSDRGRVMSLKYRERRILASGRDTDGYPFVRLWNRGVFVHVRVHRLVGKAFLRNPQELSQINHLNGDKEDNRLENLEWCDAYTNLQHAWRNGLIARYPHRCHMVGENGEVRHYASAAALARAEGVCYPKLLRQLKSQGKGCHFYPYVQRG